MELETRLKEVLKSAADSRGPNTDPPPFLAQTVYRRRVIRTRCVSATWLLAAAVTLGGAYLASSRLQSSPVAGYQVEEVRTDPTSVTANSSEGTPLPTTTTGVEQNDSRTSRSSSSPAPTTPEFGSAPQGPSEPLKTPPLASCVATYSTKTLLDRTFAFDGVVMSVGVVANPGGFGDGPSYVPVSFAVQQWFRGGGSRGVVVKMLSPLASGGSGEVDPVWGVGSRLLISGESLSGGSDPLSDPVAWYCGFSRTYDRDTASAWALALGQ